MSHTYISKKRFLRDLQILPWANIDQVNMWFYGDMLRHRRTEYLVPRLREENALVVVRWGNRNIFTTPKHKYDTHYDHGLGVTEILIRLWRADMSSTIVPTRFFRGLNCIPDGALKFGDKLLLFEFCTADNVQQRLNLKVERYRENIWGINEKFQAQSFVVFVLDVFREWITLFLSRKESARCAFFYFTDFESFKTVPIGQQLKARIYIWGKDGKEDSLRDGH